MRLLAFDYGRKRVGVASGDTSTGNASPLKIVAASDWSAIVALVRDWRPGFCLVGLPLHMDGRMSAMAVEASNFARRLALELDQQVVFADERLSSNSVSNDLRAAGLDQRQAIDDLAAARILAGWLAHWQRAQR